MEMVTARPLVYIIDNFKLAYSAGCNFALVSDVKTLFLSLVVYYIC